MSKEEKKIEILRAAGPVFFTKGFEGTKIEDIAREAGIGKGTVYEYFESKQQLFEDTLAYNYELMVDSLRQALAQGEYIRDKIIAFARFMTDLISNHLHLFDLMATSSILAREMGAIILESNVRLGSVLLDTVKAAVGKGELRSDLEPEIIVSVILGTVYQYCSLKVIFHKQKSQDIDFDRLVDAVVQGIGQVK